MEPYVEALIREAEQQKPFFPEKIDTVFLGGGTPSLLPEALLARLIHQLGRIFCLDGACEFTSEANPGAVSASWIRTAVSLGVTRFSFGMQAFQEHLLKALGRIHRFSDVAEAVAWAREAGAGVNLDLMFGIPGQTAADWERTLAEALALGPDHISAYGLIQEPGTEMDRRIQSGEWALPEPEAERAMYDRAIRTLKQHGLFQYEISNFARPGKECRHNIGYWRQVPYLGLGLSAASMTPVRKEKTGISYQRMTNPDTFEAYEAMVLNPDPGLRETETVTPEEARFETMMLGLRMTEGVREEAFQAMHGVSIWEVYGNRLAPLIDAGLLLFENGALRLSRKGMDIQNLILVELMN